MKTLRLLLGDQLHEGHSWFRHPRNDVIYLIAEMRQETDYVRHHIQKVVAFFSAMRSFSQRLQSRGHHVRYIRISDPDAPPGLPALIRKVIQEEGAERFEYLYPDEYRLDDQLNALCQDLGIPHGAYDTEHFYTKRGDLDEFFRGKRVVMESFYRMMRKKHGVLMEGSRPLGGSWNYDVQNRKTWKGSPPVPSGYLPQIDVRGLLSEIREAGIRTLGSIDPLRFSWTTTREEALGLLHTFCEQLLPHFGTFQDAMHTEEPYLFHSCLSFALNCKLLTPAEVVETVEAHFRNHREEIPLACAEGFIRQILGWREYMRGIYWKEMPGYDRKNALGNHYPLPDFFWTGKTKMNCLRTAIVQSLETGYAHHIQRLMITGNYALLAQTDPREVDRWYLGIYADAIEWVQLPNTRGMSQFADGGIVGTKPYISSANYIHKMGNYCENCRFDHRKRTGEDACPFNALYWNFLWEKRGQLSGNPRMGMMYRLLDKKDAAEVQDMRQRAADILAHPEKY